MLEHKRPTPPHPPRESVAGRFLPLRMMAVVAKPLPTDTLHGDEVSVYPSPLVGHRRTASAFATNRSFPSISGCADPTLTVWSADGNRLHNIAYITFSQPALST